MTNCNKRCKHQKKDKYIKDKSLIKFLMQHYKKQTIDFSKVKISSFLDSLNNKEEEKENCIDENLVRMKNKLSETINFPKFPTFKFSLLKDSSFCNINNSNINVLKINSRLFC